MASLTAWLDYLTDAVADTLKAKNITATKCNCRLFIASREANITAANKNNHNENVKNCRRLYYGMPPWC